MTSISLARLRARSQPLELAELAGWSLKTYPLGPFASGLRPRRYSQLLRPNWFEPLSLASEIVWCSAILQQNCEELNDYLSARNVAFDAALHNDLDTALASLSTTDQVAGLSLTSMSQRIALLHLFKGVAASKQLVDQITKEALGAQAGFVAYWMGVRIEDRSTTTTFRRRVRNALDSWKVGDGYKSLIRFLFLDELPVEGEEPLLLSAASSLPLVDLYETFIRIATQAQIEERPSAEMFRLFAQTLSSMISDDRLSFIGAFPNGFTNDQLCLLAQDLSPSDSHTIDNPRNQHVHVLRNFEHILTSVADGEFDERNNGPLWSRLSNSLIATAGKTPPSRAANADLSKLAVAFSLTDFGQWASWAKLSEIEEHPFPTRASALGRLIYNGRASFELLPSLPEPLRATLVTSSPDPNLAAQICGQVADASAGSKLSKEALVEIRIRAARDANKFEDIVLMGENLGSEQSPWTRSTLIAVVEALIDTGRRKDAIELCAKQMLISEAYASWVPFEMIAYGLKPSNWQPLSDIIYTPIFLWFYQNEGGGAPSSQLSYATEDYLTSLGITYPIDITSSSSTIDHKAIIFFLNNICTAQTLRLSTEYETDEEIARQRLQICALLARLDPEEGDKYEQEARDIVREGLVRDALQELQGSKISIDEEPLIRWAERNLKDEYQRYVALMRSGSAVIDAKFRDSLYAAVRAGLAPLSLEVPKNEASSLFYGIVARFLHECALNPEHGIDCYLSVRIRHGTLSGMLRGPSERERIVTRKSSGFYRTNEHWQTALRDRLPPECLVEMDERFRRFSQFIDEKAGNLTEALIQVSRPEKPKAMFNLAPSEQSVYAMAIEIRPDTSFDEFMSSCLELFWALVDTSLRHVREFLGTRFLDEVRGAFDDLERDLVILLEENYEGKLLDSIRRARSETVSAIQTMIGWFELPTPSLSIPFEIPVIADVALRTFKRFHPQFDPVLDVSADSVGAISGILRSYSDIFFTLFENVSNHGGHTGRPKIWITSKLIGQRVVTTVENDLGENCDAMSATDLADLKSKISSGEYRDRIRTEGGTGLPKVAKLCNLQPADPDFDFALNVDTGRFHVTFATEFVFNSQEKRG